MPLARIAVASRPLPAATSTTRIALRGACCASPAGPWTMRWRRRTTESTHSVVKSAHATSRVHTCRSTRISGSLNSSPISPRTSHSSRMSPLVRRRASGALSLPAWAIRMSGATATSTSASIGRPVSGDGCHSVLLRERERARNSSVVSAPEATSVPLDVPTAFESSWLRAASGRSAAALGISRSRASRSASAFAMMVSARWRPSSPPKSARVRCLVSECCRGSAERRRPPRSGAPSTHPASTHPPTRLHAAASSPWCSRRQHAVSAPSTSSHGCCRSESFASVDR